MPDDQEIAAARTLRVHKSMTDTAQVSPGDAAWYRKMSMVHGYRYSHGSLSSVVLFPPLGHGFSEDYLTDWEREWSVLARFRTGGVAFVPVVDESGVIIAHQGVTHADRTQLIAPLEDLLHTLPESTINEIRVDLATRKVSDFQITYKHLSDLLINDARIFVHDFKNKPLADWRKLHYIPGETNLALMVSVNGQLFAFVPSSTGFLKEGLSPIDLLLIGNVLLALGNRIGTRMVRALVRKITNKGEARLLLAGPTRLTVMSEQELAAVRGGSLNLKPPRMSADALNKEVPQVKEGMGPKRKLTKDERQGALEIIGTLERVRNGDSWAWAGLIRDRRIKQLQFGKLAKEGWSEIDLLKDNIGALNQIRMLVRVGKDDVEYKLMQMH